MAAGTSAEYFTIPGLAAGGDLSSHQYKFVKPASTAGQVIVATSATSACLGVLLNDPSAQGQAAEVAAIGVVRILSEDSVSAGNLVASSTTGRAKAASTSNNKIMGKAVEAGSAGDIITIILAPSNY